MPGALRCGGVTTATPYVTRAFFMQHGVSGTCSRPAPNMYRTCHIADIFGCAHKIAPPAELQNF
jgi:hypothetical protein